jgi:negative regulator of sigma E activity
MQRVRHVILTVLFSLFSVSIAIADENAMQLLEKTGTAAKTLKYDGIFAY